MPTIHSFIQDCSRPITTFHHRFSSLGAVNMHFTFPIDCIYSLPFQPPVMSNNFGDVYVYGDYIEFFGQVNQTTFPTSTLRPSLSSVPITLDSARLNNPANPNVPIPIGTLDWDTSQQTWVINLTDVNQLIPHVIGYQYTMNFTGDCYSSPPFRLMT